MTDEIKKKISKTNKIVMRNKIMNDKQFLQKILEHNKNNKYFTSKNQVLIRDFIIRNHSEDGWTFGGSIKCENFRISRDLYSKKLKISFEYDGIVHFQDIFGQLQDKRNKDLSLEKWCIKNGWKLIRISESWFIKHKKNLNLVEHILYNVKKAITKLGDQYYK